MMRRAGFLSLLATQGLWVSRRTPRLPPAPGPVTGVVEGDEPDLSLLALGDSIVAGVGVRRSHDALPARLARELSRCGGVGVRWRARGLNGARSTWILQQLEQSPEPVAAPDLVVISNGINDVTTTRSEADVLERLVAVVEAAERRFPTALVCQLGLPPLGWFPALPQPLRQVLGQRASRIDQALGEHLAGRPTTLHLPFDQPPDVSQFASDGYHPGEIGVAAWAELLAPPLLDRLVPGEALVRPGAGETDDTGRPAP
jgi:lysophospholipase L1-like esterase